MAFELKQEHKDFLDKEARILAKECEDIHHARGYLSECLTDCIETFDELDGNDSAWEAMRTYLDTKLRELM